MSVVRIGRAEDNDMVIPESAPGVGRYHARAERHRDGTTTIEDTGSRNGTFVDGWPANGSTLVQQTSVVTLGKTYQLDLARLHRLLSRAGAPRAGPERRPPPANAQYVRCGCGTVRLEGQTCASCGQKTGWNP